MRSTIIIRKRGEGYICTVSGRYGGGYEGARIGLTSQEAATKAAREMIRFALTNPDGGDLMAPDEVMALVPFHLRSINTSI